MTILITEDQYEKLLKASLKRHVEDPEPNIEGGTFDLNGDTIKYSVFIRKDGYVYVYYSYLGQKHKVHIMPEESFIRLNKKEQEDSIEFRIKKDIQKKIYYFYNKSSILIHNLMYYLHYTTYRLLLFSSIILVLIYLN